jgi:ribosomal protein S18 acetylase RimI-like enzyme
MHIRPAEVTDRPFAVEMIYESMGEFADELFGLGDHELAMEKLDWFYCNPENHFSYYKAVILEIEGQPAGYLQAMTGLELARLVGPMTRQTYKIYGLKNLPRVFWKTLPLVFEKEAEADEYYISNLAVHRDFRRRGVAQALMRHAELTARKLGLCKCSLMVEIGNDGAKALYERLNYQVVSVSTNPLMRRILATPGSERMVKHLNGN